MTQKLQFHHFHVYNKEQSGVRNLLFHFLGAKKFQLDIGFSKVSISGRMCNFIKYPPLDASIFLFLSRVLDSRHRCFLNQMEQVSVPENAKVLLTCELCLKNAFKCTLGPKRIFHLIIGHSSVRKRNSQKTVSHLFGCKVIQWEFN